MMNKIIIAVLLLLFISSCTIYWEDGEWGVEWTEETPTPTPTPNMFDKLWNR